VSGVTRYAKTGGVHIAYQTIGDGPRDIVLVAGWLSHVEMGWESPPLARLLNRLASFSRLIVYDKRGTGLSDPVVTSPSLDERMDDLLAVMDAAGSEQAVLFGECEGAPLSVLFAAVHPERIDGLALYGAMPCVRVGGEMPHWIDDTAEQIESMIEHWGEGRTLELFAPSIAADDHARRAQGEFERASASPGMALALLESLRGIDVSVAATSVHVPAVVLHRSHDPVPIEPARELARLMPGARFVELDGADHALIAGHTEPIVAEIEELVTGGRGTPEPGRALLTLLFTDIVGSTDLASEMGDATWRELLGEHNRIVRRQLSAHQGREVKSVGDGFLATFEGPARAIWCAQSITAAVRRLGIEVRAGIHTGETELLGDDVGGVAVHIAARVVDLAGAGEVLVTRTVADLMAGSGMHFTDKGRCELKGVPGEWSVMAAETAAPRSLVAPTPAGS